MSDKPREKSSVADITEAMRNSIENIRKGNEIEKELTALRLEMKHELAIQQQNSVANARVLTGRDITGSETPEEVSAAALDPTAKALERNKSVAVQSVSATVGALLNILWITYAGTEAPAEVYAAIPILIQITAQALATAYNNTGVK